MSNTESAAFREGLVIGAYGVLGCLLLLGVVILATLFPGNPDENGWYGLVILLLVIALTAGVMGCWFVGALDRWLLWEVRHRTLDETLEWMAPRSWLTNLWWLTTVRTARRFVVRLWARHHPWVGDTEAPI